MRKTSAALFYRLTMHNLYFRAIIEDISSRNHPKICNIARAMLFPPSIFHPYQINLSRNFGTFVKIPVENPLNKEKVKEKSELLMDFESARTTTKLLESFKEMEGILDEGGELGTACLCVAIKLDRDGNDDPQKILSFATKAFNDLSLNSEPSLVLAKSLQLMGTACFKLNRFNDSLAYLNKANNALDKLDVEGSKEDVRFMIHSVQLGLANVKTALGMRWEALENLKKSVEMNEKMIDKNSKGFGVAYRKVADALAIILNFKEALTYCLKSLEIHQNELGDNSVEVVHDRQLLEVIYKGLGEHNKALEQNELYRKVLMKLGMTSEMLRAELDNACLQIDLGNHTKATDILKRLIPQVRKNSEEYALVFIFMGNALYRQENFADAMRCLDIAYEVLNKKETVSPVSISKAYMELALQYETMDQIEKAVSILKRAFSLLDKLPREQHFAGSVCSKLGCLLLSTGEEESEAILYLETGATKLEESLGKMHFGVGNIYNNLGNAYLKSDMTELAIPVLQTAKDILTTTLGFDHIDTIKARQNLAKSYASMKEYSRATEIQVQVIQSLKSHGPSLQDDLEESLCFLEQIAKNAPGLTLKSLISKVEDQISKAKLKHKHKHKYKYKR